MARENEQCELVDGLVAIDFSRLVSNGNLEDPQISQTEV